MDNIQLQLVEDSDFNNGNNRILEGILSIIHSKVYVIFISYRFDELSARITTIYLIAVPSFPGQKNYNG